MERKKASDFPQELLDLFHQYVHGDIDRRAFLDRAGKFAVGGLTAAAIFESAASPTTPGRSRCRRTTTRIKTEYATVPSPQGNGIDQGLSGAARERGRQVPAVLVDSREPRPQPVHRGRRAPASPSRTSSRSRPTG